AKLLFLFDADTRIFVAIVGACSTLLGAYKAIFERDLKRVLAYSTISQLGLMMLAIGLGSAETAFFHLLTHAFFKAGLFLCAGAILDYLHNIEKKYHIHADFQDMHLLGGLREKLPLVFLVYTLCMFSLVGLPFFSGFLSKEAILASIWQASQSDATNLIFFIIALLSTFLTAFYIAKQWFLVFFGEFRLALQFPQMQETTPKAPMAWQYQVVLSILGFSTLFLLFSPQNTFDFLQNLWLDFSESNLAHPPIWLPFLAIFLAVLGVVLGFWVKSATKITNFLNFQFRGENQFFGQILRYTSQKVHQKWQEQKQTLGSAFWLTSLVIWLSEQMGKIERIWSNFLDNIARTKVVLAHIVAWLDKSLVDGFIHFLLYLGRMMGEIFRNLQGKNIQAYFGFVIFFLLLSLLTYLFL
ncbi:MAG: proton-conducting transporter membrane subunit, partial [Raineya sp.]